MDAEQGEKRGGFSRRTFLQAAAGTAAARRHGRRGHRSSGSPRPVRHHHPDAARVPVSISLYQQAYQNWAGDIVVQGVWTAAPATSADVVTIANWAYANGWRVRPKGMGHGWSPLILPER